MKIALTGASGHLGYNLHQKLVTSGIDHRLLLRSTSKYITHKDIIIGDLESTESLHALVKDCTTVIHSAAIVWPRKGKSERVQLLNFECSKRFYEIAVAQGVKHFIYVSSIHSMEHLAIDQKIDESALLCEDEYLAYNFSKAEMERFLNTQKEIKITIVNPTALIGSGDIYVRGMNQLFQKIEQNKLPIIVDGGFNIIDVKDVADAIIYAAIHQKQGKFILGNQYISIKELAILYGEINQLKVTHKILKAQWMKLLAKLVTPFEKLFKEPLPFNTYSVETLLTGNRSISSQKAQEELHLTFRPLKETLKEIHHWFMEKQ